MTPHDRNRIMALAGIYQALALTRDVAEKGMIEIHDLRHALEPVFKLDAADVDTVYGSVNYLKRGIESLVTLKMPATRQTNLYLAQVLNLERKLDKAPALLDQIANGIQKAQSQSEYFGGIEHENIIASLAQTYQSTISTLSPRIQVRGDSRYLEQRQNADKVRALLLSAIRSAVLWRQMGGRRWRLLFSQGTLIQYANALWRETEGYHIEK